MNWGKQLKTWLIGRGLNSMNLGLIEYSRTHRTAQEAAQWQREQLRTDEAVERLANFLFEDDNGESIDQHEKICHDVSKCRFRSDYTQFARATIDALLGEG